MKPKRNGLPRKRAKSSGTTAQRAATRRRASPLSSDERRRAILQAALRVFAERGFTSARLDDVAAKAGIAKGTVYLYFADKEALFEELIRSHMSPVLDKLEAAAAAGSHAPSPVALQQLFDLFRREVLDTDRKYIIQLLIAEGPHFPKLAEFYFREVVVRGMKALGGLLRQTKTGSQTGEALARYPQLVVAPLLVAVIWDRLFGRFEPLDVEGMLRTHYQLLGGEATP